MGLAQHTDSEDQEKAQCGLCSHPSERIEEACKLLAVCDVAGNGSRTTRHRQGLHEDSDGSY